MKKISTLLSGIITVICLTFAANTLCAQNPPTAEAGQNQTICKGGAATLTASGGGTYLWSTNEETASIIVKPGSTTQYKVTVTDNGLSAMDSVVVTVNEIPDAEAGANSAINLGTADTLTALGGGTYVWSTGDSTAQIIVIPTNSTDYKVTVTGANGCTAADDVLVIINQNISASEANYSVCAGQAATLTAPTATKYSWSTGDTTKSAIVATMENKNFWVTVTYASGYIVDTFKVMVRPNPKAEAGSDTTIQNQAEVILTATATENDEVPPNMKYNWSTGSWSDTIHVEPAKTTMYTVTAQDMSGCTGTDNVTVYVGSSQLPDSVNYWHKVDCMIRPMKDVCQVGIGMDSIPDDYILGINGKTIASDEITIKKLSNWTWPDFVFEKNYPLATLSDVEEFLSKNKHLPDVPSASEINKGGIQLGEMNALLLKKIEELTLYQIELNKEIKELHEEIATLKAEKQK